MPRPRTPKLSPELIARAAIAEVDSTGDFTIEGLARALGVVPSSLYSHVTGRSAIIELTRNELIPSNPGDETGLTWEQSLTRFVRRYRDALGEHPRLIPVLTLNTVAGPETVALYQSLAGILRRAGFSDDRLLDAVTTVDVFTLGAALDLATPDDTWLPERFPDGPLRDALSSAPRGRARSESAFAFGLEVLVAGLSEALGSDRPTEPSVHGHQ
ncbi:TetR/AcrR family transcriptional regulator C-terminal domain-containing protein [Leifsonia shinshuensis]|uniref:TetR/AcrR family transcriptional regulator C-terminal domain-containing protein n=1 Tax=Leifsonia shinshuensis TaxID=150026 RepID=UPI001F515687|nr:TetR/AcrR family transcriptional regulator C-terminal domain-containing protein [Leifsonia shinshuensis]MCI0156495.1 TetR/AcrR family transcriptional regulator C-terminal domain-containing protein [Leifsonia shinshuensis]